MGLGQHLLEVLTREGLENWRAKFHKNNLDSLYTLRISADYGVSAIEPKALPGARQKAGQMVQLAKRVMS